MWQRKQESEIRIIKQKLKESVFNLSYPLIILVVGTPMGFIGRALGLSKTIIVPQGFTLINFIQTFIITIIITIIIALLVLLFQILTGRSLELFNSYWKMCDKCKKEISSISKKCKCGGSLEPIEFYERA
jgi:hypothetical protein